MKKKLLTLLLASTLIGSQLVGCGPASNNDSSKTEKAKDEQKDSSKEQTKNAEDLSAWNGTWNDMGSYLNKDSIQDAFKTLAKNESKDGKNITAEEAKEKYLEKRKNTIKAMKIDKNKVFLLKNTQSKEFDESNKNEIEQEIEYTYVKDIKSKLGSHELTWHCYTAKDAKSDEYKNLAIMSINPKEELKHFHFKYGSDDFEKLIEDKVHFPTMVATDTTDELIINEITE